MIQEEKTENKLTKTAKSIVVSPEKSQFLDQGVIKKRFYNSFNYSMIPDQYQKLDLTIGVTSPNKKEGKTITAANLAVSFALAHKKKTVLVDLNLKNPVLHSIFGTNLKPGLVESLNNGSIFLSKTKLDQLYLLPAGRYQNFSLELGNFVGIRDIIYSLRQEFEAIILDMNSVFPIDDFPAVLANQTDGLLVVIDTEKTKYADVKRIFRYINKNQTIGFVMNKVDEESFI